MLIKNILIFIVLATSINAEANLLREIRNRRNSQHTEMNFSFNLFPGSLIQCTNLRDGDDLVLVYHHENEYPSYNVFERMYSSSKDCTLDQEMLLEFAEDEPCFINKLEQLSSESIVHAEVFEEELRTENPALLRSYQARISFLVKDHRESLLGSAISAITGSNDNDTCPWEFSTLIEIKVTTTSEDEHYERLFEDPTF